MEPTTEIRHLPPTARSQLSTLLDTADYWKDFAELLPKPDGRPGALVSSANMRLLEQQKLKPSGSPSQALLDYWGTSGRKRPTIQDLYGKLVDAKLLHAAHFVRSKILLQSTSSDDLLKGNGCLDSNELESDPRKEHWCRDEEGVHVAGLRPSAPNMSRNQEPPSHSAAPRSNENVFHFQSCSDNNATVNSELQSLLNENSIVQVPHRVILKSTNNLSDSFKLGEGAFGAVYKVDLSCHTPPLGVVAVKILKSELNCKQFITELKVMSRFQHENLLSLLAMSSDSSTICLLSPYMSHGSLLDTLACKNDQPPLSADLRLSIAVGTAKGIVHLHTNGPKPFVHRDIKSANILLDDSFIAKVGDFGLVRIGSAASGLTTKSSTPLATSVIGTSVYMAPEAFRGDVSVKLDSFSYGVVLLELLTGLPPFDEERDEPDILSYVDDRLSDSTDGMMEADPDDPGSLSNILDDKCAWEISLAKALLQISRDATLERKKNRPTMEEILARIAQLVS